MLMFRKLIAWVSSKCVVREYFSKLDFDSDGIVSREEFDDFAKNEGWSEEEAKALFAVIWTAFSPKRADGSRMPNQFSNIWTKAWKLVQEDVEGEALEGVKSSGRLVGTTCAYVHADPSSWC